MKNIFISVLTFIITLFSLSSQAADTYQLDPNHTYVLWHANHFGFSNPSGKWIANGTLVLDEQNPQESKVDVTIKMEDLSTGIPEFDKHLKGKLFFNTTQFPTATFVSNKVIVTSKQTAQVQGTLTVHGVSNPVELSVKFNKAGINPVNDKETVGFSAQTTLNRSDFGITTLSPGVSDEIKIDIEAEAFKVTNNKNAS